MPAPWPVRQRTRRTMPRFRVKPRPQGERRGPHQWKWWAMVETAAHDVNTRALTATGCGDEELPMTWRPDPLPSVLSSRAGEVSRETHSQGVRRRSSWSKSLPRVVRVWHSRKRHNACSTSLSTLLYTVVENCCATLSPAHLHTLRRLVHCRCTESVRGTLLSAVGASGGAGIRLSDDIYTFRHIRGWPFPRGAVRPFAPRRMTAVRCRRGTRRRPAGPSVVVLLELSARWSAAARGAGCRGPCSPRDARDPRGS